MMQKVELYAALKRGEELGVLLYEVQLSPETKLKRFISLCKKMPKDIRSYSWHYLQENPSFVLEQKLLKNKPYVLCLVSLSNIPELLEEIEIYFANLDEVSDFLQQFGKQLTDFHRYSKDEYSL